MASPALLSVYTGDFSVSNSSLLNQQMMQNVTWNSKEQIPEVSFSFLRWGREYCVRLRVEDRAGAAASEASEARCLVLPLPGTTPATDFHSLTLLSHGSGLIFYAGDKSLLQSLNTYVTEYMCM